MNKRAEFLPFHAINEFMRPDFRLSVVRDTLSSLPDLGENHINRINSLTRKLVKVPGFRNSEKAPSLMKVVPMAKAFEKSPDLVAAILAAWAESNQVLQEQVYTMLKARGWTVVEQDQPLNLESLLSDDLKDWPVLPLGIDRTRMPGFFTRWPKGEDYETLFNNYTEMYPQAQTSIDTMSLMAVWLSLRLPYQMEESTQDNPGESDNSEYVQEG